MKYLLTAVFSFFGMILLLFMLPFHVKEVPLMRRLIPSHAIATGWREQSAYYRLTVIHAHPGKPGYLDLRSLCVPGNPANGIRIYRESDWKPISLHQYDGFHAYLPPADKLEKYEVYYDFSIPQRIEKWNRKKRYFPDHFRLRRHDVRTTIPTSPYKVSGYEFRKPFVSYSRLRRELWRSIGKLMTAQIHICTSIREKGDLNGISVQKYKTAANDLSAKINSYRAASRDFLDELFYSPFRKKSAGRDVPRIFFTTRPFDSDRTFLSCYKGSLIIPEDGIYEFRLNSNSTRLLRIDGREVYRKTGIFRSADSSSIGSTDYISLKLEKGIVFLEYIYYKENIATWASLSWRKKGDPAFRLLSSDDFAPAPPVIPLKLEDAVKRRYPLIRRDDSLALYTSKDDPYSLDRFTVLNPEVFSWKWNLDGSDISSDFKSMLLHPGKSVLRFLPDIRSGYTGFSVPLRKRAGEKVIVKPDLALKFHAPHFLYDDEFCTLTIEIISSFPAEYSLKYTGKVSRETPCLKSFSEILTIPAMPIEGENRYAQSLVLKMNYPLQSAKLNGKTLAADYTISIPPQEFDRKSFLLAPVSDLPELTTNSAGLCDREGRKVIPLLHRMSLHEVRSWELLRKIGSEFHHVKKVLVIAEDFGGFRQELASRLKEHGIELEFIPLSRKMMPSGSPFIETIPEIMKSLKQSDADTAVLIPPGTIRHGIAGPDTELHAAAMASELLMDRRSIRSVILATPFPFSPDAEKSLGAEEEAFCEELRKLRREKGFRILELNRLLRKDPLWTVDSYRENGIASSFPLGLARRSAELIASEIARKNIF